MSSSETNDETLVDNSNTTEANLAVEIKDEIETPLSGTEQVAGELVIPDTGEDGKQPVIEGEIEKSNSDILFHEPKYDFSDMYDVADEFKDHELTAPYTYPIKPTLNPYPDLTDYKYKGNYLPKLVPDYYPPPSPRPWTPYSSYLPALNYVEYKTMPMHNYTVTPQAPPPPLPPSYYQTQPSAPSPTPPVVNFIPRVSFYRPNVAVPSQRNSANTTTQKAYLNNFKYWN